jgi:hypothetical protein
VNRFLFHMRLELLWLQVLRFYWRRKLKSSLKTNETLKNYLERLKKEDE